MTASAGRITRFIQQQFGRDLVNNTMALYGVHIATYVLPLVSLPYLARVLGPSEWGLLALVQSLAQYLGVITDYGFDLSATRDTAQRRHDKEQLAELVSGVLGAKLFLAAIAVTLGLLIGTYSPALRGHSDLLWIVILLSVAPALNCMWYFQGLERMRTVALFDVSARVLGTAGTFVVVRAQGDGWKYLLFQGFLAATSTVFMIVVIHRELPFKIPRWSNSWHTLRSTWHVFLFRGFNGLFTTANVFLLGFYAPPAVVGYFASAEKIVRSSFNLLWPLTRAVFPHISHAAVHNRSRAIRIVRLGLVVMVSTGLLIGAILAGGASLWIHLLFGKEFGAAAPVLRILAILAPVMAVNTVLAIHWLLPLGRDRCITRIVLGSAVLNILCSLILAPRFGAVGMAWSVTLAEVAALVGLIREMGEDTVNQVPILGTLASESSAALATGDRA